jgi:hypothetical protein
MSRSSRRPPAVRSRSAPRPLWPAPAAGVTPSPPTAGTVRARGEFGRTEGSGRAATDGWERKGGLTRIPSQLYLCGEIFKVALEQPGPAGRLESDRWAHCDPLPDTRLPARRRCRDRAEVTGGCPTHPASRLGRRIDRTASPGRSIVATSSLWACAGTCPRNRTGYPGIRRSRQIRRGSPPARALAPPPSPDKRRPPRSAESLGPMSRMLRPFAGGGPASARATTVRHPRDRASGDRSLSSRPTKGCTVSCRTIRPAHRARH